MVIFVLVSTFVILFALGVPIAFCLGLSTLATMLFTMDFLPAVTTIALVTVTALIGQGGLGFFILRGLQRFFNTEIILGTVLSVALAVIVDLALVGLERLVTPWSRRQAAL